MGVFRIGGERIGIVTKIPVLDDDSQPTYTEYGEPIYADDPLVELVDHAMFEVQTKGTNELQGLTVTTNELAWVFLPVADGLVPLVDEDGNPAGTKAVAVITSSLWLQHDGILYAMRGDAVLERSIRGRQDHVFCVCERQEG